MIDFTRRIFFGALGLWPLGARSAPLPCICNRRDFWGDEACPRHDDLRSCARPDGTE